MSKNAIKWYIMTFYDIYGMTQNDIKYSNMGKKTHLKYNILCKAFEITIDTDFKPRYPYCHTFCHFMSYGMKCHKMAFHAKCHMA